MVLILFIEDAKNEVFTIGNQILIGLWLTGQRQLGGGKLGALERLCVLAISVILLVLSWLFSAAVALVSEGGWLVLVRVDEGGTLLEGCILVCCVDSVDDDLGLLWFMACGSRIGVNDYILLRLGLCIRSPFGRYISTFLVCIRRRILLLQVHVWLVILHRWYRRHSKHPLTVWMSVFGFNVNLSVGGISCYPWTNSDSNIIWRQNAHVLLNLIIVAGCGGHNT